MIVWRDKKIKIWDAENILVIKNNTCTDMIYFDNAATSKPSEIAINAWNEAIREFWGNPSSSYRWGRIAKERLEEARSIVGRCIGAEPEEIVFASGGTEGINTIIKGCLDNPNAIGNYVLTTPIEHSAVLKSSKYLIETGHYGMRKCSVDSNGIVDAEKFEWYLHNHDIGLTCAMIVNNEIGCIEPIHKLCKLSHQYGVPFFTDAVQAAGHIEVDVAQLEIDYLVLSGHKFNAPKGVGALYVSRDALVRPIPLLHGGGQENGLRASTEDLAGIWSMVKALEWNCQHMKENQVKIQNLKRYCVEQIQKIEGVVINADPLSPTSDGIGIINFSVPNLRGDGQSVQILLDGKIGEYDRSVMVSTGSACSSGDSAPSHVLMALPGMTSERASRSIRVSLCADNTEEEINYFLSKLNLIIELLGVRE